MVLGIDIGATKTWAAYLRKDELIKSRKIKTQLDPRVFLKDLKDLLEDFLKGVADNVEAIGIGAPGPIDLKSGIFRKLPNLSSWDGFNIKKELRAIYHVPVRVQNDANAAALGEALHGGGKGYSVVYYITISTGIGGGLVIEGQIINGSNELTGEIWALPVFQNNCGHSFYIPAII